MKAAYGMHEQAGGEELGPGPSEGLDQAQRRWFSDLHAAKPTGSQHGFAGLSSVTSTSTGGSPKHEDLQYWLKTNASCRKAQAFEASLVPERRAERNFSQRG